MCLDTACLVMANGSASSLTVAGPAAEAGDDPPPHRVGEGHERPIEPVVGGRVDDQALNSLG